MLPLFYIVLVFNAFRLLQVLCLASLQGYVAEASEGNGPLLLRGHDGLPAWLPAGVHTDIVFASIYRLIGVSLPSELIEVCSAIANSTVLNCALYICMCIVAILVYLTP